MIYRDYYIAVFISYPMSTRDTHISPRAVGPRVDMGQGLIWGMVWKLPYHDLFIKHFSFWQVCLLDIVCGVKARTPNVLILFFVFFCPGKTGVSPMLPSETVFFARTKKPYHPRDHYHTFLRSTRVILAWKPCQYHICKMYIYFSKLW